MTCHNVSNKNVEVQANTQQGEYIQRAPGAHKQTRYLRSEA